MKQALKDLTLKYLNSLPTDVVFSTSKKAWLRDDLIREVQEETEIGKQIVKINEKYLLA